MEKNYKIGSFEAVSILVLIMINKLILNVPYYIINLVGNGAIINIIYVGIIDFILSLIILKLFKKFNNLDIIDISEILGGKKLKYLTGVLSIIMFFLFSFITLSDFANVLHTIYFSNFQMIYILLFFIIGVLIANLVGIRGIIRTISFIVSFAIISVIITFFATVTNLDISSVTPVFGQNIYNTFVIGLGNMFSMYIIIYFYFINPLLKEHKKFKKISILSYLISFGLLFLTIISLLTLYNTTSTSEPINSLFLLARQIEFGTFLQRADALFILLWIFSIYSYLSFTIFLINKIIKKLFNINNERIISYSTCSLLFGLALIPFNTSSLQFIENNLYRYLVLFFIFGYGLTILILSNITNLKN